MRKILISLAASALAMAPAAASDKKDVMAVVRQWAEVFGALDSKKALAACADETLILDDVPPYLWQGTGSCATWLDALNAFVRQNGITEPKGTLSKPWRVDVAAGRAYVVVPITFTYKMGGKDVREPISIMSLVLQKGQTGWRITGWSVAAH